MDGADKQTANALMAEGKKMMEEGKTTWLFFKQSPDYSRAAELFTEAANSYKCMKAWKEAGEAFMKAAEADTAAGEPEEAARRKISAASCFKKIDPARAVDSIQQAIQVFLKSGRFHLAASHEKEIGEIYESLLDDPKNAAIYYERAGDRYAAEDSMATALSCQLKAGHLYAINEEYEKAVAIFGEVAKQWAGDDMKRYSMKDYLLKLGLCLLCTGDLVHAKREIEAFGQLDHNFAGTNESALLHAALDAMENNDQDKFTEAVAEFDQVGLLDDWKTKILLRLKKTIIAEDESLA